MANGPVENRHGWCDGLHPLPILLAEPLSSAVHRCRETLTKRLRSFACPWIRRCNLLQGIHLVHEGRVFQDATVYMSGNAFYDCKFIRCTLVVREGGIPSLVGCTLQCCNWHLDLLVSDHRAWDSFMKVLAPIVRDSLPRAFSEPRRGEQETAG